MVTTKLKASKMNSIGLRISSENKEIIRMAANYTGQDLTSYLISTAMAKAKKDILEHKEILLSKRDYDNVVKETKNPTTANRKMKLAFRKHSKKFKE
ncbi:MAG: DUF1778 domain-containing protein [Oligoflexia bacterium]|nr:DUF1778 domain-containing protein [Oligoflexia bacterium]